MKLLTHPAATALGLTTLIILPMVSSLVSTTHRTVYHMQGPVISVFFAVMLLILMLWLLITGLLMLVRRSRRIHRILWTTILCALPWVTVKLATTILDWSMPHRISLIFFSIGITAMIALLIFWTPSFQRGFDRIQNFAATLLGFVALSSLLMLVQLGWFAWQAHAINAPQAMHRSTVPVETSAHSAGHSRIIWLLLDELSYRQVYEHRFPGLRLPAFDRLAQQSTIFTHAIPAGLMTEYVIPSLLTGVPANALRASADGRQVYLHNPAQNRWETFDQHQTIFQDALNRGYRTAVGGWYNPYCRILPQVLDRCFWTFRDPTLNGIATDLPLRVNLLRPIQHVVNIGLTYFQWNRHGDLNDSATTQVHIDDYRELFTESDTLLDDPSLDFLYLHMPIPHPGGIYNRRTGQLTTGPSTYIDNLALADTYLAHFRSKLEQSGEWDSTTILIMGDHSWRTTSVWSSDPSWTSEEQNASDGGKFDTRPAYIVKLPNQQQPERIDTPFPAIETRALLDALMDQHIQSPQELAAWANTQAAGN